MGFPVKLYVYELSRGLASKISAPLLGRQIDGIWHTGITVYGKEYYFGHFGIANVPVGSFFLGNPTEIVELGETEITEKEFQEHVNELVKTTFAGHKYQLLKHNCNTFSNEAAKFLTGNSIPEKITNLPNDVLSTPFGQMIHPHIDSIVTQFRQAIAIRDDKSFHSHVISLVSSVSITMISNPQSLAQAQNPGMQSANRRKISIKNFKTTCSMILLVLNFMFMISTNFCRYHVTSIVPTASSWFKSKKQHSVKSQNVQEDMFSNKTY